MLALPSRVRVTGSVGPMRPETAWQALAQSPLRFVTSAWPWRSLAYLLSGVAFGAVAGGVLLVLATAGVVLLVVVVGAALLVAVVLGGVLVARVERLRLRLVDLEPAPDPHRPAERPGLRCWLTTRLHEPATWRELGFAAVSSTALWWMDLLVLTFALVLPVLLAMSPVDDPRAWPWVIAAGCMVPAAPYTLTAWAGARAALTRVLLAPRDGELGPELTRIRASRARLVDAFDAERRRIERDLHDGAQQRLVSLNVALGVARLDTGPDGPLADRLSAAQEQLTLAVHELRELSRGVHPKSLTDHGLAAAVDDLAARTTVPTAVDIRLPHRLPQGVETTAYFVVAEALANVTKHSRAGRARVRAGLRTDLLTLEVGDDGAGGADPEGGGLTGLADRVAAAGGRLHLASPPGGPTLLHVEMPCR